MSLRDNNKGFSLVELLVVFGIIGIISGISVTLLSHIKVANNEKVVQTISTTLSKQQARTMSKKDKPYLYLYQVDGEYYVCLSTSDVSTFDSAVMNKTAGNNLGAGCSIYAVDSAGNKSLVTGTSFIKVVYKRDGSFDMTKTNCSAVSVELNSLKTKIKLIAVSGKHVISVE